MAFTPDPGGNTPDARLARRCVPGSPGGTPLNSRVQLRSSAGYVSTGPGYYVWEETRSEALRSARDLTGVALGSLSAHPSDASEHPEQGAR